MTVDVVQLSGWLGATMLLVGIAVALLLAAGADLQAQRFQRGKHAGLGAGKPQARLGDAVQVSSQGGQGVVEHGASLASAPPGAMARPLSTPAGGHPRGA